MNLSGAAFHVSDIRLSELKRPSGCAAKKDASFMTEETF